MVTMNILMSGGTGLVGKELGKSLIAQGHKIFLLTRSPEKSSTHTPYAHTAIRWDATHPEIADDLMSKIDGIINLAGQGVGDKRWSQKYKAALRNSRTIGTQHLVDLANRHQSNIQFFISTSAVGYYGKTENRPVTEEAPCASQQFLGQLCQDWEKPLWHNLVPTVRRVIFRVGVVLSEKGGALEKIIPPVQMGYGGNLGNGQQKVPWIDIADLVSMYTQAVSKDWQGVFNAVAPEIVSNAQLTATVGKAIERSPGLAVPGFALKLAVGEFANYLLESQCISCQKILDQGFDFKFPTLASSLNFRLSQREAAERVDFFEQWVPQPRKDVFPFFADAKNLEKITPPLLHFKILEAPDTEVHKDMIIKYKIKINGLPFQWITRIAKWEPPELFVDNQEKGPYKKWHHQHGFYTLGGGTLLTDTVNSIVPMGRLGRAVAGWKVYGDVQKIFKYRRKIISEMFGMAHID